MGVSDARRRNEQRPGVVAAISAEWWKAKGGRWRATRGKHVGDPLCGGLRFGVHGCQLDRHYRAIVVSSALLDLWPYNTTPSGCAEMERKGKSQGREETEILTPMGSGLYGL